MSYDHDPFKAIAQELFGDDGPEAECQGKKFDMTITLSLGDLVMNGVEDLQRIFEKKIGTDEMGGLKLGFLSIVDEDTVLMSVKGTVDEYAPGSINRHIAVDPDYKGQKFGPCVPDAGSCEVPEHWKWED